MRVPDLRLINLPADVGSLRTLGTAPLTACEGSDARLGNARTPTIHAASHGQGQTDAVTITESQVTNLTTDLAAQKAFAVAMAIALGG